MMKQETLIDGLNSIFKTTQSIYDNEEKFLSDMELRAE